MKHYDRIIKTFEVNYKKIRWCIEIVKTDENPDDLFDMWLYPDNYGVKQFVIGEYREGRSDRQIYDDLIDYLYIKWENPEDHVYRNCFENFMLDHPEDF